MRRTALSLSVALALASSAYAGTSGVLFVDDDSTASMPDGLSWATAFASLQDALDAASVSLGSVNEVRVAQGRYTPDLGASVTIGDRASVFNLVDGVDLVGGYFGIAGPGDPDAFDPTLYPTILSGDLLGDDSGFDNQTENAYQVVRANGLTVGVSLNGLRIEGGNVLGAMTPDQFFGAGVRTVGSINLEFNGSVFRNNFGGGLYADNSTIALTDCDFDANSTGIEAQDSLLTLDSCTIENHPLGGIECEGGDIDATDSTFRNNRNSALAVLWGFATITGCLFEDNVTTGVNGAGIRADLSGNNEIVIHDCDFVRNVASNNAGGGVFANGGRTVEILNCEFIDNEASRGGGVSSSRGIMRGCRFEGNSATGPTEGNGGGAEGNRLAAIDCVFVNNTAQRLGGGLHVTNSASSVTPTARCLFAGNESIADGGGGLAGNVGYVSQCVFTGNRSFLRGGGAQFSSTLDIDGCVFYGNVAEIQSPGGLAADPNTAIRNTVLWFNGGTSIDDQINISMSEEERGIPFGLNHNCIMGWTPDIIGTGNFGEDPLYVNPEGADGILGTEDDDYTLGLGSPCIDAGTNTDVMADAGDLDEDGNETETTPEDFAGNARFFDDPLTPDTGEGASPIVDIGPLESDGMGPERCLGDCDGSGSVNFGDLVCMLGFFDGYAPSADCNLDSSIDFGDLVCALGKFGPCP